MWQTSKALLEQHHSTKGREHTGRICSENSLFFNSVDIRASDIESARHFGLLQAGHGPYINSTNLY